LLLGTTELVLNDNFQRFTEQKSVIVTKLWN